jgi:hypothetical protein
MFLVLLFSSPLAFFSGRVVAAKKEHGATA